MRSQAAPCDGEGQRLGAVKVDKPAWPADAAPIKPSMFLECWT